MEKPPKYTGIPSTDYAYTKIELSFFLLYYFMNQSHFVTKNAF